MADALLYRSGKFRVTHPIYYLFSTATMDRIEAKTGKRPTGAFTWQKPGAVYYDSDTKEWTFGDGVYRIFDNNFILEIGMRVMQAAGAVTLISEGDLPDGLSRYLDGD